MLTASFFLTVIVHFNFLFFPPALNFANTLVFPGFSPIALTDFFLTFASFTIFLLARREHAAELIARLRHRKAVSDTISQVRIVDQHVIDGGAVTSVQYMSCTQPIPATKSDIAVATAQAGQLLGLGAIYLEAGSGARHHVPFDMISAVAGAIDIPLIVGGGIRDAETAARICQAGADMIVVGSALEKDPSMLVELREAVQKSN